MEDSKHRALVPSDHKWNRARHGSKKNWHPLLAANPGVFAPIRADGTLFVVAACAGLVGCSIVGCPLFFVVPLTSFSITVAF